MNLPSECDVLVTGAGPAGCVAAARAAESGARTLLIDAKTRLGERPHCGEFVPRQLLAEFQLDGSCVTQSVDTMITLILAPGSLDEASADESRRSPASFDEILSFPDVTTGAETPSPGYLIDRARFDRDLARTAAQKGALVLSSTRLSGKDGDGWILKGRWEERRIVPKVVIAADGAASTVAARLSAQRTAYLRGVQIEAPLSAPLSSTHIVLGQEIPGGYGWLFPKGSTANVGLGVSADPAVSPRLLLEALRRRFVAWGLIRPGILASTSGLIPVSGMREHLTIGSVVFCGDAAGLTHPVTGAGMPQAIFSGWEAGYAAAEALRGRSDALSAYETAVKGRYGGVLRHALQKRRKMDAEWNQGDFADLCRQCWIAFEGYRRRERSG